MRALLGLLILSLAGCGAVNFEFSVEGAGSETTYSLQNGSEFRRKIADRHFLVSHLEAIFGSLGTEQKNLILSNPSILGGKEDYYEAYSATNVNAESNPVDMSARQAILIRTCNSLMQDNGYLKQAVSNVLGLTDEALDAKFYQGPAGEAEVEAFYAAFFPGRPLSSKVIAPLLTLGEEAQSMGDSGRLGIESWRFILLMLCLDPTWQLL